LISISPFPISLRPPAPQSHLSAPERLCCVPLQAITPHHPFSSPTFSVPFRCWPKSRPLQKHMSHPHGAPRGACDVRCPRRYRLKIRWSRHCIVSKELRAAYRIRACSVGVPMERTLCWPGKQEQILHFNSLNVKVKINTPDFSKSAKGKRRGGNGGSFFHLSSLSSISSK